MIIYSFLFFRNIVLSLLSLALSLPGLMPKKNGALFISINLNLSFSEFEPQDANMFIFTRLYKFEV